MSLNIRSSISRFIKSAISEAVIEAICSSLICVKESLHLCSPSFGYFINSHDSCFNAFIINFSHNLDSPYSSISSASSTSASSCAATISPTSTSADIMSSMLTAASVMLYQSPRWLRSLPTRTTPRHSSVPTGTRALWTSPIRHSLMATST